MRTALVLVALLVGCSAALPARLAGTVHVSEEQGIDYSGASSSSFVLTLRSDRTGEAVTRTRSLGVLGSDVVERDRIVRFDACAEWDGPRLDVTLRERVTDGVVTPIHLTCERWGAGDVASTSDAEDPSLPGVEWICAVQSERPFALGLVTLQHVPREGEYLLLGTTRSVHVEQDVTQSWRRVSTRVGEDAELPAL